MSRLSTLLRLLLVLSVALTAVHTAIGRAEARGALSLVICADGSATTVTFAADGQPVLRHHGCPDCVLGGLSLAGGAAPLVSAPLRLSARLTRPAHGGAMAPAHVPAAQARGPPQGL